MKSYHIILKGHALGEMLGSKNIEIARGFGLDAYVHPGVKVTQKFDQEFKKYNINKISSSEMQYAGQQGCFLAHFQLWQKCIKINEPIVICEHDGVFLRSLPDNVLDKFTDVLRLEPFHHWKPDYLNNIKDSLDKPVTYKKLKTKYKTHYVGYYGYVIKPNGAQKLIKHAQQHGVKSVDRFVDTRVVDIKSVTASIVMLDETYIGRTIELSTTARKEKV